MPVHQRRSYLLLIISSTLAYISAGAFQTTGFESLYMESRKPVLAIQWQILLCSCTTKVSSLKKHLCCRTIPWPSLKLDMHLAQSKPSVSIGYKKLLGALQITIIPPCHPESSLDHAVIFASMAFLRHIYKVSR
jgi:hypothetical protein